MARTGIAEGAAAVLGAAVVGYGLGPDIWGRRHWASVRRAPGRPPLLALTFDDGPHPEITPVVLSALEAAGARATFFMVGANVRRYPALVRRVRDQGHAIGVHTMSHRHAWLATPARLRWEMRECLRTIVEVAEARPLWFRPPYGSFNLLTQRTAAAQGLRIALWSCDAGDWLPGASGALIRRRVLAGLEPGAVIDLHDGGQTPKGCWAMARSLPEILEAASRMGLRGVHLGELFGLPAME